jgi:stage III sporulation protein AH
MKEFKRPFGNIRSGSILLVALLALLFWGGFQMVHRVNQVNKEPVAESPLVEPPPLTIPKEYNPGDTLLDLKLERDRERSEDMERVQQLLEQAGLSGDVRKSAEKELWRLTQATAREHELENLLLAKGFDQCLVTVGEKLVTVVVAHKLQPDQAKLVGELAADISTFNLDQIQIVER